MSSTYHTTLFQRSHTLLILGGIDLKIKMLNILQDRKDDSILIVQPFH